MIQWCWFIILLFLMNGPPVALSKEAPVLKKTHFNSYAEIESFIKKYHFKKTSPDYPIYEALKACVINPNVDPDSTIKILEPLFLNTHYQGIVEKTKDHAQLGIGTFGGFPLWRDLSYLLLGNAYYQKNQTQTALKYLESIPKDSPFFELSKTKQAWTLLRLKRFKEASALANGSSPENSLIQLVGIFHFDSLSEANQKTLSLLHFDQNSELEAIRLKLLAESKFKEYQKTTVQMNEEKKLSALKEIIELTRKIKVPYRDGLTSNFAAEVLWNTASLLRITNPIKNEKESLQILKEAQKWIDPLALKSLKEKTPLLDEESYFLDVAILWEQGLEKKAIPYLKSHSLLFPQGKYLEDSYQLLGDFYYEKRQFKESLEWYQKLAKRGSPEKAAYGVYKAAWSYYQMQDKWASLRHFERLYQHHLKAAQEIRESSHNLSRESTKAMLMVMAENLSYQNSKKEIEFLTPSKSERLSLNYHLIENYEGLGRFKEAITGWRALLKTPEAKVHWTEWVPSLLSDLLADSQRQQISKEFSQWIQIFNPKKEDFEVKEDHQEFERKVSKIILTLHYEAKKSDDPEIWKALDQLYPLYERVFPPELNPTLWLFSAQRYEMKNEPWKAVSSYQNALHAPQDFANRPEAEVQIFRITKRIIDRLSLEPSQANPKEKSKTYTQLKTLSNWLLENAKSQAIHPPTRLIHLESLIALKDFESVQAFFESSIKKHMDSALLLSEFNQSVKWLYEKKNYRAAFDLSDAMLSTSPSEPLLSRLREIRQESAFQTAFLEKDVSIKKSFYEHSLDTAKDPDLTLRTYSNLVKTYEADPTHSTTDIRSLKAHFESFVSSHRDFFKNSERSDLVSFIYLDFTRLFKRIGEIRELASLFEETALYSKDPIRSRNALHESALLYALLGEKKLPPHANEKFKKELARVFFYIGAQEPMELSLDELLQADLFGLSSRFSHMANHPLLLSYWQLTSTEKDQRLLNQLMKRNPASSAETPIKEKDASRFLDQALQRISITLKEYQETLTELLALKRSQTPQIVTHATCRLASLQQKTVTTLEALKYLGNQQTKVLSQYELKRKSIQKEIEVELKTSNTSCSELQEKTKFLPPVTQDKSLCDDFLCSLIETSELRKPVSLTKFESIGLHEFISLIQSHNYSFAYLASLHHAKRSFRSLFLGILRMKHGDYWNAASLFQEVSKDPELSPSAHLLMSRIIELNGHAALANTYWEKHRKSDPSPWKTAYKTWLATF